MIRPNVRMRRTLLTAAECEEAPESLPFGDIIYALVDPRDELVHYVGITRTPGPRYRMHETDKNPAKRAWFDELVACGLRPRMVVLEWLPGQKAWENEYVEQAWIAGALWLGMPLLNRQGVTIGVLPHSPDEAEAYRMSW